MMVVMIVKIKSEKQRHFTVGTTLSSLMDLSRGSLCDVLKFSLCFSFVINANRESLSILIKSASRRN